MNEQEQRRLIKAFIDIRRCLQNIAAQGELTQGEFLVLRRIKVENQDSLEGLSEFKAMRISQYLSMPPPAISRIFNSLEGKGLIQRQLNRDNRRSVIVRLTESGEKALINAEARVKGFMERVNSELGEGDSYKLLILLERVIGIFNVQDSDQGGKVD